MPCTMSQAHNQILALLRAALPGGLAVKYPDMATPAGFPPASASWVRVGIEDVGQGQQPTLVNIPGNRRYTTDGILTVEIYTLAGDGRRASDAIGEALFAAFRGQRTAGGVWFRRERFPPIGDDGVWWHANFVAEYQYNTLQ